MFYTTLRAFDETARTGSVRKASAALGVAPSSVSRSIAILEHEMGTALFERGAGGVTLTHAGQLVADYARSVLLDFDTLRADLDDMRGVQRKLIRVVVVEGIVSHGPVHAIAKLLERFRSLSFNVRLMPAPQVFETVQNGRCDLGVAFCAEPDPDILTLASVAEPIVCLVRADDPVAAHASINLRALEDLCLAVPDFDFGIRRMLDRACAEAGVRIAPALTSNGFEILRRFVHSGAGAAILPKRAATAGMEAPSLKAVPISWPQFRNATIDVITLRRRRMPRIVRAFAEQLIDEIRATG